MRITTPFALALCAASLNAQGEMACEPSPGARYDFSGVVGERVAANLHNWLLPMPQANPGVIEMMRRRDRKPEPDLLPWSGEFAGKHLITAIQARRMVDSPELDQSIRQMIADLGACQAEDGYLGPWPREQRLLGQWDLWGHYHILTALLDWHQDTGDAGALRIARGIGDCLCGTYLDTGKRVIDAGSPEMNMAILTGLVRLHRVTGEERYLRMAREVEKDWEQAGDYFRQGLAGVPFYRTPKPRWESLHDLQGLVELYRVTGDERYKTAFTNLWHSIRRLDVHNTGGFSTGEQATGDPYAAGAIETCCTVAWMTISADMLQLTGDVIAADELERSTYNGGIGAQHPSGRWWTYNTPMDGVRRASAHDIVFQARPGTPELNCCSVNAPRILGVLSEWAVLRDAEGLRVSFYGPGEAHVSLADGTPVVIRQETRYPLDGEVALTIDLAEAREFVLRLRIPGWSAQSAVKLNGDPVAGVERRSWLSLEREWRKGDRVELSFDMSLRAEGGEGACSGRACIFRGPLLLAWDQRLNRLDEHELPVLDMRALKPADLPIGDLRPRPWLLLEVGPPESRVVLCDFASAGAAGNPYRTWLPASGAGPGVFHLTEPADGARLAPGELLFSWVPPARPQPVDVGQTLIISREPGGPAVHISHPDMPHQVVDLQPGAYVWQVVRERDGVSRPNEDGWRTLTVEAGAPAQGLPIPVPLRIREDGVVVDAPLAGVPEPSFGELSRAENLLPAERNGDPAGAVSLNGRDSKLVYSFAYWPTGDFSASAWFCLDAYPRGRIAQVVSGWCQGGDDPLRITIDDGKVVARIEGIWTQPMAGIPVELGRWYHVAAVRQEGRLRLYLDGQLAGDTACASTGPFTQSAAVGVGCNPLYNGNECLPGRIAGFRLYARALTPEEIARDASAR